MSYSRKGIRSIAWLPLTQHRFLTIKITKISTIVEPGTVPARSKSVGYFILPITVASRQQRPHFTDGETEAEPGQLQV